MNTNKNNKQNRAPFLYITATTIAALAVSVYCLYTGWFIVFQNILYIPIILACVYFTKRGFVFSGILSFVYLFLIFGFTSNSDIILQAIIKVVFFIGIAGVTTYLSLKINRSDELLHEREARRKSEDALEVSEINFRAIFDQHSAAIVIIEEDSTVSMVNNSYCRLSGNTEEEVVGKMWMKQIPQNDLERMKEYSGKRLLNPNDAPSEYEFSFYHKNGELRHGLLSVGYIQDSKRIIASFIDITDRKQAEKVLNDLIEKNPMSIQIIDKDGFTLKVNNAHSVLFGAPPPPEFSIFADLQNKGFGEYIMLAKKGEIVHLPDINYNVDNVFPVLPNKPVWIRAILFPLLNTAGIPERFVFMHEDITERKLVEEKLNESEIRFRTLSENELVGVYILKQGKLFYVNPELASIFGYKVNELIGASPLVVIHADDHALVTKNIRRRVEGEVEKLQYEFHGLCKNGEIKNIEVRGSHVKINNESVIIGNIMDITQRKLAEAELRRSEEQFRSTLDNMLEGCQIIGFDWKYIYINNTADIHNRRPKEELLGRKYMDIWPGIEDTEVFRNINICLVDRIQQQMENEFIYPDGAIGWFDISIQPVPEGVFILSIDITERKKTEKALKENEALFSTIFKSILIPVSLSDLATEKWVEVNDAFLKVTGYSRSETIGKSFRDINLWKNIEDRLHMRKMLLEKGRVTDYEVEINKKNGTTGIMLISVEIVELAGKSYLLIMGNEITERKKAEQAMKESEEKFRMSFMTGLDAFYIATLEEGRMIDANLNFENVFGYTREEAIGKTSLELNLFYDPDDRRKMISELKLKGFVRDMELMGRKKSGELITISISINQMMLENQPHIIGVIRDITERKKTESELMHYKNYLEHLVEERTDTLKQEIIVRKKVEQALTDSENKYRNLVEYSTSIVLEWDTEGNILFMNKYGLEFFGYEKEEILGKKVLETIVEPVDSNGNNLSRKIQIIQKHPDDYNSSENENVRKNGEKVWIAWSNKGIYDTSGKLLKTLSVGIDRSKQREMEKLLIKSTEDLSEAEELYYTTVNSLDSWVFVIDDQQKILFINARLKKFLYQNGFDLEVIGMDMRKALGFLNEELFVQFDKVFKECTDTEREDEFEISGIKYFTLSKLSPILMNKKVFRIVTTIHDHTKIKQVEVEIMKNLERERDLNSLKTQFISTVSHEFRTPLAGILSSAQLLKIYSDTWDEEKKEKIFKQIFDSVKHTIALLDDASIINKGENNITIRPVLVNLNELLLDIVNENMQVYGNDIEILTSFILPKSKYKFDRDIIRHIFGNILSNALKYSGQSKKVIFNVTDENEQILFNIIDYGIGIPVDDQKFLFEPFHRASNVEAIRGTGFGLSIVKKLVDMLNGKIEIISEVGKGTNITIKLPYNTLQ